LNADLRRATRTDGSARTRDGINISYTLHGDPASPRRAALVHSVAMDRQFWQPVAERLAKDTAVVTFDSRGHGASDKPAPRWAAWWRSHSPRGIRRARQRSA
jgi:pimeloyl-ACP methyl ester carboxylesterase